MKNKLLLSIFFSFFLSTLYASHFRGGKINWTRASGTRTVTFSTYAVWESASAIGSMTLNTGDGNTVSLTGTEVASNGTQKVYKYDYTYTYGSDGPFTAYYYDCCRISTSANGADGSLTVSSVVYLANNNLGSPVSTSPVLITMPQNTANQFQLTATEPNNGNVTYLATALQSSAYLPSAGGNTASVSTTGLLQWNTTGTSIGQEWFMKIVITGNDAVSKTELDFLIKITSGGPQAPVCLLNGNSNNSVVSGTPFSISVSGTDPEGQALTITNTGVPSGMTSSTLSNTITYNWTPTATQTGVFTINTTFTDPTFLTTSCSFNVTVSQIIDLNNGLVSCYAFTTNAVDGVGKNNGTNNGATLTTDRLNRVSNAYNFDGNDYISSPSNGLANSNYTYSTWVFPSNLPAYGEARTILSVGESQVLMLVNNANTSGPSFYLFGYEQNSGATPFVYAPITNANQWYHVVAVRTNTAYKIYVNGAFMAQVATANLPTYSSTASYIGIRSITNTFYWNGKIDDVRIYNYALNDAQVSVLNTMNIMGNCDAQIHNESGLISCYTFSGDAKDEYSNNHGTASNATLSADRFGNANSAYTFAGAVSSHVQLTNPAPFVNNSFTYAAWVKVNSLPSIGVPQWIFGVGQHGVGDQALYVYNDNGAISFTAHSYANPSGCVVGLRSVNGGVTVQANRWYHVAISMGGTLFAMYVDGKLVTSSPSTCTSLIYGSPVAYIGNRLGTVSPFPGVIDDVRIYNRTLPIDEVKSLRFTKGCRTKCPETLSITNTYSSPLQPTRNEANEIVAINVINTNTEIRYDALKSIMLQPGFNVNSGAVFEALINGCAGNK